MRFMLLMFPGPEAEKGVMPDPQLVHDMVAFNQRLIDAGIMLGGEGLMPTSRGARVTFGGAKATVVDGPFTETKEVLGGFWLIQAGSLAEAVEVARQAPCPAGETIEIRQVFEPEDFGEDVAKTERDQIAQMEGQKRG